MVPSCSRPFVQLSKVNTCLIHFIASTKQCDASLEVASTRLQRKCSLNSCRVKAIIAKSITNSMYDCLKESKVQYLVQKWNFHMPRHIPVILTTWKSNQILGKGILRSTSYVYRMSRAKWPKRSISICMTQADHSYCKAKRLDSGEKMNK